MFCLHRCHARRLSALALLCWTLSGHAQSRLTADDAVARALSLPHVRQRSDAHFALARSEIFIADTRPNPELELSRERGGGDSSGRESAVLLSQTFELGGRRGLRRAAAEQGLIAAESEIAYERVRLRADVLRAYSEAVAAEWRARTQEEIVAGLRELAVAAARRHDAGDLSGYESRRIAQASTQAQARGAQALAEAGAARARLAALVGDVALDAALDTDPPLPPAPAHDDQAPTPELEALDARRRHAEALADAEKRFALPLSVGVGSKRIEQAGVREDVAVFELGLPLPLFDRNQGERARTAAAADEADAQYRRALLQTRSRRIAALAQARTLSASARQLLDVAVPEARALTRIARASFAEGELDLVGLLDAYDAEAAVIDQALDQQARALDALLELQSLLPLSASTSHPITEPDH